MAFVTVYVDGEPIDTDDIETLSVEFPEDYSDPGDPEGDQPPTGPAAWCNGAGVRINESDDSVQVWVSVGDPRGGFTMEVRRLPNGELVMHLPYPGMGSAHMPLKPHHEGTYTIGHYGE